MDLPDFPRVSGRDGSNGCGRDDEPATFPA